MEASLTPEPLASPPTRVEESGFLENSLNSGIATIEKRISDVEENLKNLPASSLRRTALFVFGEGLRLKSRARLREKLDQIGSLSEAKEEWKSMHICEWIENCKSFGKTGLILDKEGMVSHLLSAHKDKVVLAKDLNTLKLIKSGSDFIVTDVPDPLPLELKQAIGSVGLILVSRGS